MTIGLSRKERPRWLVRASARRRSRPPPRCLLGGSGHIVQAVPVPQRPLRSAGSLPAAPPLRSVAGRPLAPPPSALCVPALAAPPRLPRAGSRPRTGPLSVVRTRPRTNMSLFPSRSCVPDLSERQPLCCTGGDRSTGFRRRNTTDVFGPGELASGPRTGQGAIPGTAQRRHPCRPSPLRPSWRRHLGLAPFFS